MPIWGIAHHPRAAHAACIASWLAVAERRSPRHFTAASKAQQAADWMHAQQPVSAEEHQTSSAIPEETDACRHASAVLVGAL
ncbi:hypothetical protein [Mesorhizobium sp. LNJC384A00]|uniref:hypothetical protein n=1 Tax=Mesorhizobium sp. LNJC384A00 TaxID=1287268 RepID=UPI00041FE731|nr:hypothetical protein [Mesorhizobium sp. LNJC384A00]